MENSRHLTNLTCTPRSLRGVPATAWGVQSAFADFRRQFATAQPSLQIAQKNQARAFEIALTGPGCVRRDDDVGHVPQRRLGRKRLDLEDVEVGARDPVRSATLR